MSSDVFVTAKQLAGEIGDSDLVVLDVRHDAGGSGLRDRRVGRLPGAVYVDLSTELAGPGGPAQGRRPLPGADRLQESARSWGVDQGSRVVVYDDRSGLSAARAWWLLRWGGLHSVRILAGGLSAWTGAGLALTEEAPRPGLGDVVLNPGQLPVVDTDGAAEAARAGRLFDARSAGAYQEGHIPGAVSTPAALNLGENGSPLPEEVLRDRYAFLAEDAARGPLAVHCGSGVSATFHIAVLDSLGIGAALYPGSWSAWTADAERPSVTGPLPHGGPRGGV